MWKSKNKPGFIMVEIMISIFIFFALFLISLSIQLNGSKLEKSIEIKREYLIVLENIKYHIIQNMNYDDVKFLKEFGTVYIGKERLHLDKIKEAGGMELFDKEKSEGFPYMEINIEGDEVLKLQLKLHTKILNKEEVMKCILFKGNHQ